MDENQNLKANGELTASEIKEALKTQGLSDQEIEERLLKWKVSTSGNYDPIRNVYLDVNVEANNEKDASQESSLELEMSTESIHLPIEKYGALAKNYINELSHCFLVSKDFVAAIMLVAVGEAANRKLTIVSGNYTNKPCLWLCVVGRSGVNKSEPMARILRPLEFINKDLIFQYQKAFAAWKEGGEKGFPPPKTKILIGDSTPESRTELLQNNGLLLTRDELYGFFRDFGRYNPSGEIEQMLSIWSGKSVPVDRKSTGSFQVENPFLSIVGGIQPEVLKEAFGSRLLQVNGFVPRWLFVWLDSKIPNKLAEKIISKDIENQWFTLIQNVWRMPQTEFRLDADADNKYQRYMDLTAYIGNKEDCEDPLRRVLLKLRIYVLRLALIIHLLKYGHLAPPLIDGDTMSAAVSTCNVFLHWSERAMSAIEDDSEQKRISDAAIIREIVERFNIQNQSGLARLLNRSQQYINKVLNKK